MAERQNRDLEVGTLEELSWSANDRTSTLHTVFKYVSGEAQRAIHWYLSKKRPKRIGAQFLRFAAIVATTVAGLIPILAEMFVSDGKPDISPAWASVSLVLAVALVGLDRFFGFSSAWMRFLTTEIQIRSALQTFQMDWEIQRAAWKGAAPNDDQVQDMLTRCKAFLTQVNSFLENEMAAWIQEFQTALQQIDTAAKEQVEASQPGGINVITHRSPKFGGKSQIALSSGDA